MIELQNVSYAYEGSTALDGIDFKIEKGESVCLLGPSGSGPPPL